MGEVLKQFDFGKRGPQKKDHGIGKWADGQIYKLAKGISFQCSQEAMRQRCKRWADENGYRCRFSADGSMHVVVQFVEVDGCHS